MTNLPSYDQVAKTLYFSLLYSVLDLCLAGDTGGPILTTPLRCSGRSACEGRELVGWCQSGRLQKKTHSWELLTHNRPCSLSCGTATQLKVATSPQTEQGKTNLNMSV